MIIKKLKPAAAVLMLTVLLGAVSGAMGQELRLGAGDTLSFAIVGVPETRQQAQIGSNGRIFLPYVGDLQAEGKTIDEVRRAVNEVLRSSPIRLSGGGGEGVLHAVQSREVLIDVAGYRPVYLSGDVQTVGPVGFRPGMTVRQAIVEAGGLRVFDESTDTRVVEMIFRRDLFLTRIEAAKQTIMRLESDVEDLGPYPLAEDPGAAAEEVALTESGQAWLQARSALRSRTGDEQLKKQEKMQERLDVLKELRAVTEEVVRIREDELKQVEDRVGWGRATPPEVEEAREALLQSSSRALDTADELFRAEIDLARDMANREIDDLETRLDLLERIDEEKAGLLELQRQVTALNGYIGSLGSALPVAEDSAIQVVLTRTSPDGSFDGPVERDARIMPGDVIDVRRVQLSDG